MYKSWAKSLQATVLENHKLENILDQYRVSLIGKSLSLQGEGSVEQIIL